MLLLIAKKMAMLLLTPKGYAHFERIILHVYIIALINHRC